MKDLYGLRDDAVIARELNRPVQSVRKMADQLFRQERRTGPWSARELSDLKRYLGASPPETVAKILGRTVQDVQTKIHDLSNVQRPGRWDREEIAELKRLYGTRTDEDLAAILGRSVESVVAEAQKYALAKDKAFLRKLDRRQVTRMPRWTDAELEFLRQHYANEPNLAIAQKLNRSVKSVVSKAHNLGLKKDKRRLQEMGRQNVSLRYNSAEIEPHKPKE